MRMTNSHAEGFTLPEMMISISLGLFLSILLIKIYLWQGELHRTMEDMIFLDHHGMLVLSIVEPVIRSAEKIKIQKWGEGNKIIVNSEFQSAYYAEKNAFWIKKEGDNPIELSSGVENFQAVRRSDVIHITVNLKAPHGLKATFCENITPENEKS
jgi:hypothetical protein